MEIFNHLAGGIAGIVTDPSLLVICFVGMMVGLVFAAIPGLTVVMAVILLLPFTLSMKPEPALVLLTSAYMGGVFGGAITAILLNIPGDSIHIPLLWDGKHLVRKGLGGKAVGTALFAATFGGLIGAIFLTWLGPQIAQIALKFGQPEYFAIVFFGLTSVTALAGVGSGRPRPLRHSMISLFLGMLVGTIGVDDTFGVDRFTFGQKFLDGGVDFLIVMIGIYAVSEILERFEIRFRDVEGAKGGAAVSPPSPREFFSLWPSLTRGTIVGTVIGMVPAAGATVAAFVSYGFEKQTSRVRHLLGTGRMEGIAASQSAASATVGGALTPLLTLGIPGSASDAVILGAFLLKGIQPGPGIYTKQTHLVYAMIAALYVTMLLMIAVTFLLTRVFMKLLTAPASIIAGLVMAFSFVGAYALRNNISDVILMMVFGVIGYVMRRYEYPIAPMVLGVILGPLAERAFVTSMFSTHDYFVFFKHPISLAFMLLSAGALSVPIVQMLARRRGPTAPGTTADVTEAAAAS